MTNIGAIRRFEPDDQEAFACLSGDRNPIHMNPIFARRTQAAGAVVHGVHGMLWALEQAARAKPLAGLQTIDARFNRFVHVGTEVQAGLAFSGELMTAEVIADCQAATTVKLGWGEPLMFKPPAGSGPAPAPAPLGVVPDAPAFEDMGDLSGCVALRDDLAADMFPALTAVLGPEAVAAMAAASGVVGMSCPGLHSLFSQLTLRRVAGAVSAGLSWRTKRTDARARWVVIELRGGGWVGEIICLERREPVQTPPMSILSALVHPNEFAQRRALVIGGSRGLGAATTKLIATGGGQVVLTYATGAAEAEAVADEIRSVRGSEAALALPCDVTRDPAAALAGIGPITHVYYFATPRITRQNAQTYDSRMLAEFMAVYVDGFAAVWEALTAHRPLAVLYPSTVFLDQRPKGMTEYVMAKAAAEYLCADLGRRSKDVSMLVPRIPRVLTDQTATVPPMPAADVIDVMLPLLRSQSG